MPMEKVHWLLFLKKRKPMIISFSGPHLSLVPHCLRPLRRSWIQIQERPHVVHLFSTSDILDGLDFATDFATTGKIFVYISVIITCCTDMR